MPSFTHANARVALIAILLVALVSATRVPPPLASQEQTTARWYKGNTHTHTTESDGDSTPDVVTRLVSRARISVSRAERPQRPDVGRRAERAPRQGRPVSAHQGRGSHGQLPRQAGAHQRSRCRGEGRSAEGLVAPRRPPAQCRRHPAARAACRTSTIRTFRWAFSTDELRQVRNTRLLEIFNGHPQVNNLGGGGVPGLEEVWDAILSSGTLMYGIAVDDAHTFKQPGNPAVAGPGEAGSWSAPRASRRARFSRRSRLDGSTRRPAWSLRTMRQQPQHDRHRQERRVGEVPHSVHRQGRARRCRNRSTARPSTSSGATRATSGPRSSRATAASRGVSRRC